MLVGTNGKAKSYRFLSIETIKSTFLQIKGNLVSKARLESYRSLHAEKLMLEHFASTTIDDLHRAVDGNENGSLDERRQLIEEEIKKLNGEEDRLLAAGELDDGLLKRLLENYTLVTNMPDITELREMRLQCARSLFQAADLTPTELERNDNAIFGYLGSLVNVRFFKKDREWQAEERTKHFEKLKKILNDRGSSQYQKWVNISKKYGMLQTLGILPEKLAEAYVDYVKNMTGLMKKEVIDEVSLSPYTKANLLVGYASAIFGSYARIPDPSGHRIQKKSKEDIRREKLMRRALFNAGIQNKDAQEKAIHSVFLEEKARAKVVISSV